MIRRSPYAAWLFLLSLAVPSPAWGVATQFWATDSQGDMNEGRLEGMSITSGGRLVLAPGREVLLDSGELYVWALGANGRGDLFAATGDDGIIYRIPSKGDPEILFDSLELEILCLVVDEKGWVYAGTSPDGMVLRISPDGKGETFFDSPEDYVWDLVPDGRGNLYAATGDEGRIYRIGRDGEAELFYDATETHIMCLLYDERTGLYAGGEGRGLVYRIRDSGQASVLYDAEEAEVSALAMDGDGHLFAAAVESPAGGNHESRGDDGEGSGAAIYRISPTGTVSRYWRVPADFVFDLEVADDGRLLVATGGEGELYAVGAHQEWWKIVDLDEVQILDLLEVDGALLLGTGNTGRVYRLGGEYGREGTFTSKVFGAQTVSTWGTLRWEGERPEGCQVHLSLRSGNTAEPDETWSDWSAESREAAVFDVPAARYAQWRARCESRGDATPVIESVTLAYLERNLAPALTSLVVLPAGETFYEGVPDASPAPVSQVLEGGIRIQYSVTGYAADPVAEDQLGWVRSIRTARWEASDPNDDGLVFEIYYRGEGETRWKPFEEEWADPIYSWESHRLPDGRYRLRVVARDTPGNPETSALSDELVSDPFEIDNTAPEVVDLAARGSGGKIEVTGRVRDRMSPLKKGRYSVDSGRWHPFVPEDGLFDELEETLRLIIPIDEPGEHTVLLQIVDAAGNPGVGVVEVK